jgi:hypothetical protein
VEGLGEEENTVNWYFSNYNNENSEPYIGPGGGALEVRSAKNVEKRRNTIF